jgi:FtsZ-binding cell division protein ZapB
LLEQGEYETSLREAEAVLEAHAKTLGDEALLLTGLIYAHPDNPYKDYRKSLDRFGRLKQEYPESRTNQLAYWFALFVSKMDEENGKIGELKEKTADLEKAVAEEQANGKKLKRETERLQEQTQALKDQLVKLKEIDLVIEQKKHQAQ